MARPSLKAEKTEHILQAYERCIGLYGVEGATLQKVAEEADMARPLLRHYVGNQDDLLAQSIDRYFSRQSESMLSRDKVSSVEALLANLFDADYIAKASDGTSANDIMIASAFTLAAQQNAVITAHMKTWFSQLQEEFLVLLKSFFPKAKKQQVRVVSTGLIGIYFNLYAMQPVEDSKDFFKQSLAAAQALLSTLEL